MSALPIDEPMETSDAQVPSSAPPHPSPPHSHPLTTQPSATPTELSGSDAEVLNESDPKRKARRSAEGRAAADWGSGISSAMKGAGGYLKKERKTKWVEGDEGEEGAMTDGQAWASEGMKKDKVLGEQEFLMLNDGPCVSCLLREMDLALWLTD